MLSGRLISCENKDSIPTVGIESLVRTNFMDVQGFYCTGKTGKMTIAIPCQLNNKVTPLSTLLLLSWMCHLPLSL